MQENWVRLLGQEDPLEKIGYPLQYSWASLVAQLVKNLPAIGYMHSMFTAALCVIAKI